MALKFKTEGMLLGVQEKVSKASGDKYFIISFADSTGEPHQYMYKGDISQLAKIEQYEQYQFNCSISESRFGTAMSVDSVEPILHTK